MDQYVIDTAITTGLNGGFIIKSDKPYVAVSNDKLSLLVVQADAQFTVLDLGMTYQDGTAFDPSVLGTVDAGRAITGTIKSVTVSSGVVFGYR